MTPEVTKIGNKLFDKVELASQRIELALLDDINKARIDTDNIENSLIDEVTKAVSILENGNKIIDKAILSSKNVIDNIDKARVMSKELGIDLPKNLDTFYKYYQDSIKSYTLMKNTISSFNTKINSI
jgi:hypothetical protein